MSLSWKYKQVILLSQLAGNDLIITTTNFTEVNVYARKVEINGKELDLNNPFVQHSGKGD